MMTHTKEWEIAQFACIVLLLVSIVSGLTLLILIFTKILPSTKKKNISIRIPKLMTIYLYITTWILLIVIPITSSLFCFVDFGIYSLSIDNHIAAILFSISIIPLIITHISRFALLRIQHGIQKLTMAFNLGEITWRQYLDKFEIILQEDYNITNPLILRKYTIYLSLLLITTSIIIILLTHPFFYIWINSTWLGIATIFTSIIVWIKSDNFNIKHRSNKFRLDTYSILKEMHGITIIFLIQFVIYLCVSTIFIDADMNMNICEATVSTHLILSIGLTLIWIIQLKYALQALYMVAHTAVPLTQLLSSFDGYKAFLRFLVSELSIENLEFFQLSMRWRYRICCWLYGVTNGTKQPAQNIDLPFQIFSFQYVDRLLPQSSGGGLVPNFDEKQQLELQSRDSDLFFTTLPMSRKVSVQTKNSRTTTPKLAGINGELLATINGMYAGGVTAPSSLHKTLPPTIEEGSEEEMELTHTDITNYPTRQPSQEDGMVMDEYSLKDRVIRVDTDNLDTDINDNINTKHITQNTMIIKRPTLPLQDHNSTPTKQISKSFSRPVLSPLTMTAPINNHEEYLRFKRIPREDEMIDIVVDTCAIQTRGTRGTLDTLNTPPPPSYAHPPLPNVPNIETSVASSLLRHQDPDGTPTNVSQAVSSETETETDASIINLNNDDVTSFELSDNDKVIVKPAFISTTVDVVKKIDRIDTPELRKKSTDLCQHLTPVEHKNNALNPKFNLVNADPLDFGTRDLFFVSTPKTETYSPNTPEPKAISMPDIDLISDNDDNEDGMEYVDYHEYTTPKATTDLVSDNSNSNCKLEKKKVRSVRFADIEEVEFVQDTNKDIKNGLSNSSKLHINDMQMVSTKSSDVDTLVTLPAKAAAQLTMQDLLAGHMGVGVGTGTGINNWVGNNEALPLEQQNTETFTMNAEYKYKQHSFRDESVASKAAEPSWFAAWFRKGNVGGQAERAETLLHYSDLSWRRLKKVSRDVNMSAMARGNVDALFRKYARSRYLETKEISLEEYDACMCNAWVSCWENMNDSLRRFAKSGHYEKYLASIGQLTIRKVNDEEIHQEKKNNDNNNNNIVDMNGMMDEDDTDNELSSKKLKFRIKGSKRTTDHTRAPAVMIT